LLEFNVLVCQLSSIQLFSSLISCEFDVYKWGYFVDDVHDGDVDEFVDVSVACYTSPSHPAIDVEDESLKTEDLLINGLFCRDINPLDIIMITQDDIKTFKFHNCLVHCNNDILDIFLENKGRLLYAAPHSCITDHFVIIISTFKGKAICLTPFILPLITTIYEIGKYYINHSSNKLNSYKNCSSHLAVSLLQNGYMTKLTFRHLVTIVSTKLQHDVEVNPGPEQKISLKAITLNCRGLGDINKFRLLLNRIKKHSNYAQTIVMLQETMISSDDYLKLAWRGKYVHTPGTGNSHGCITLLPATTEILLVEHFGTRGHKLQIQGILADATAIVTAYNIYAPNGFGQEKTTFLQNIFDNVAVTDGDIILAGDFNTTLGNCDRHNRGVTVAETRTGNYILDKIDELNLTDAWHGIEGYTWRRGQVMSKLDRIIYRLNDYVISQNNVDWTVTSSDHAAVLVTFEHRQQVKHKNDHVKLDNDIIKNTVYLNEIREYVIDQLSHANHMNPHMKLEFAKMSIRTISLAIMKRERKREISELNDINCDIVTNTALLTRPLSPAAARTVTIELEDLNVRKENILQSQGAKLAQFARKRWYNDGEKSNKYFLNLLKRRTQNNEMTRLMVNGQLTEDQTIIRNSVTDFYDKLYNNTENVNNCDHLLRNMFSVTQNDNESMSLPLTLEELWLNLKNTKATTPGPDGMSNTYLKKLWHVIGPLILNAWQYSIETGELPPSHKSSILRLIPKQGKDTTDIKNWRPITLSNCDHKLITRTYNSRLLRVINQHVTPTQTAYIKGRNISDNLRLLNSAVKLSEYAADTNGIIIALDAQKAFDSVNHEFITAVLNKCALTNFIPIFKLLYKDLQNNIMINGRIGNGYRINNGVKQGDALSCSLFILAIEPVIRNIIHNNSITALRSNTLNFSWPKVLGYADDLTIITNNDDSCINAVFSEYEELTKSSQLKLNADKTEIFTITGRNVVHIDDQHNITYLGRQYTLNSLDAIKINGITFNTNRADMQTANFNTMIDKMNRHFLAWSKRSLSLLGKIQIIKTYGLSQYLYTLAVTGLSRLHWKAIRKNIYKFIWNKNMNVAPAPHRIRRDIMLTPREQGGFGLVDLESVMVSSRIKRFSYLMDHDTHPIAELQRLLCNNDLMRGEPRFNIDDVTTTVLSTLNSHYCKTLSVAPEHCMETDFNLQSIYLHSQIRYICRQNKLRSAEMFTLLGRNVTTLSQAMICADDSLTLAHNILP
jgi:endonuclease/exonuclease/phosphatase (EEP) superfamily protein YafD